MAISKIKTGSITDSAITEAKLGPSSVAEAKLSPNSVTSAKITDGSIVNADINACAAIASSKLSVCTAVLEQNISLLGFKMAVNEGLTVFNLVDGVVDEFHDESGTDESEGSNDTYCAVSDYYVNGATISNSAGFTTTSVTESDTSTAGTNPAQNSGTYGSFTVPSGVTSVNVFAWGAGGGQGARPTANQNSGGGGGGFASGTLATAACTVYRVIVGEGGEGGPAGPVTTANGLGGAGGIPGSGAGNARGGGLSGVFASSVAASPIDLAPYCAPQAYVIAGGGGGGGYNEISPTPGGPTGTTTGGAGGGLCGQRGDTTLYGTGNYGSAGGGGSQTSGGQAGSGPSATGQSGSLFAGGNAVCDANNASGGGGFYGGGGAGEGPHPFGDVRAGGGGSSYHGHPQVTCGATEAGNTHSGGGTGDPNYVAGTNEGVVTDANPGVSGEDGYMLITAQGVGSAVSTTLVSTAFAAGSVPTTSRIVVFEENVDTPTLNTDIIASISRDGGSTYTTATLTDSGYVTGSSGQRILTGQATISGQPSGQSMRWKLALANNQVRIHGVSLQWA